MTLEDRINRASELFKSGYNCSQSVVAAFADMYGFTEEQALRMAASFGGGIGRMRETCGAVVACFCLPDWRRELSTEPIVKGRLPIMLWYKSLQPNSRNEMVR